MRVGHMPDSFSVIRNTVTVGGEWIRLEYDRMDDTFCI